MRDKRKRIEHTHTGRKGEFSFSLFGSLSLRRSSPAHTFTQSHTVHRHTHTSIGCDSVLSHRKHRARLPVCGEFIYIASRSIAERECDLVRAMCGSGREKQRPLRTLISISMILFFTLTIFCVRTCVYASVLVCAVSVSESVRVWLAERIHWCRYNIHCATPV